MSRAENPYFYNFEDDADRRADFQAKIIPTEEPWKKKTEHCCGNMILRGVGAVPVVAFWLDDLHDLVLAMF